MASTATTPAPARSPAGSSTPASTSTTVDVALGPDGRVRLRGLALAACGEHRVWDVRQAPAPARPAPVPLPDRLADPVDVLAARLAVSARPQPDAWRRDVLVHAMLVDAAHTRQKGRPTSGAVVLGTHEAAERLAKREGRTRTTGRDANPDNTSLRRSLVRLEEAGLIDREVIRDCEDQERWTVCTLLPLPPTVDEHAETATALLARWLDERPATWSTPLRRLARRQAERRKRADARTAYRHQLADAQRRAAIATATGSEHPQNQEGASPCGSSPLKRTAGTPNGSEEKTVCARVRPHRQTKTDALREGGEAGELVGRLVARLRPLLASLTASEADRVGNDGLGWLSAAEQLRWARTVARWEFARKVAPDGWGDLDALDLAYRTAWDLTAGGTEPIGRYLRIATRYEHEGIATPRPLATIVRTLDKYTKDLIRIAKERRERAALHAAAAAAIQPPHWLIRNAHGHGCWRTDSQHLVLRAHYLPDDAGLMAAVPTIRSMILAHPGPCHGQIPTSILIADRHGDAVRIPLRAARGNEDPAPRGPIRLGTARRPLDSGAGRRAYRRRPF